MNDAFYMQLALDEAWKYQLLTYPNPAVGAVVVKHGRILSVAAHQKAGTSHAEVLALLSAYESLSDKSIDFDRFDAHKAHAFLRTLPHTFFAECTIYVTLEPCAHEGKTPSCASLLETLNLQRIVIGLRDPIKGHDKGAERLKRVTFGVCEAACRDLLEPFVIWQKRAFVLFKLAQTTNGRIGGGYLSSKASLTHVHRLREVCDRLLIGGSTVREDRPTLDCRFSGGRAPDVMIYSRDNRFDRSIPLFGIEGRSVEVTNRLEIFEHPAFIIVEGGEGMLRALQHRINWMLLYQTPKLSTNDLSYNIDMNLTFLHQRKIDVDLMIWSRHSGD
jgi:diaminohydroxyphosphoribosylaminopyrimidine deaminase/5-amino-6-(5-phosphoribosylamino)uracil reductase